MKYSKEDFIVTINFIQNMLQCKITSNLELGSEVQYAYYLIKDGERIDTIWYSKQNTIDFLINKDGIYSINCFVKSNEDITIYKTDCVQYLGNVFTEKSEETMAEKSISFDIWGSCVSRDIFEYDTKHAYKIKSYIARNSIVSALSPKISFDINDIKLDSNFQRRQVINDLEKTSFNQLIENQSDYLLIDFIDERFKLASFKESIITMSNEVVLSGIIKTPKFDDRKKTKTWNKKVIYRIRGINLIDYIDMFCEKIRMIYGQDSIIIHKALMSNHYINSKGETIKFEKNHIKNNEKVNELLEIMYDRVQVNLPNAHVIDIGNSNIADENHKWGLSPMHYRDEYYIEALDKINYFTKDI